MVHIGENVRWLLKKEKKSARSLAEFLQVSETHVQNIFNNENPQTHTVIKIAKFLDVPEWLLMKEKVEDFYSVAKEKEMSYETVSKNYDEKEYLRKQINTLTQVIASKDEYIAYLQRVPGKRKK